MLRIAIVDDSAQHLELARRNFEREGWRVLVVDHQIGATNRVRAFDPDVVVLDIDMPVKGTDLIHVMRREVPRALFVLMSAADEVRLKRSVALTGANLGLSKSEDFARVIDAIVRLVQRERSAWSR